ncbi:MAG TPA: hypothetical protein VH593_33765 [Ktedonobacteraceae bacterium]
MEVLQLLFDHFWLVVLFFFLFGGSIWGAIEWTIRRSLKHRERMQELKNEELQLQLKIAQMDKKQSTHQVPPSPTPKEATWEEREHPLYETGYQQQQQQNH